MSLEDKGIFHSVVHFSKKIYYCRNITLMPTHRVLFRLQLQYQLIHLFISCSDSKSLHSEYLSSLLNKPADQKENLVLIKLLLRRPVLSEEVICCYDAVEFAAFGLVLNVENQITS